MAEVSTGKAEFERTRCNEELVSVLGGNKKSVTSRSFLCPNLEKRQTCLWRAHGTGWTSSARGA